MKGISAVIATILMLLITIALAGVAYLYIQGTVTQKTGIVLAIDESATTCVGTDIQLYVKNIGTLPYDANKITVSGTNSNGGLIAGITCYPASNATSTMAAGGASVRCVSLTGTAGTNTIVASGATTVRGTVYCSG
jgi:flagellin-like protein